MHLYLVLVSDCYYVHTPLVLKGHGHCAHARLKPCWSVNCYSAIQRAKRLGIQIAPVETKSVQQDKRAKSGTVPPIAGLHLVNVHSIFACWYCCYN